MERQEKVLIEVDYIKVLRLKKRRRAALKNISSRAHAIKQVLLVINRNQLTRDTVEEAVRAYFRRPLSKYAIEVIDYRTVESEEKRNTKINQ